MSLEAVSLLGVIASISSRNNTQGECVQEREHNKKKQDAVDFDDYDEEEDDEDNYHNSTCDKYPLLLTGVEAIIPGFPSLQLIF